MLARRELPAAYEAWNMAWGAPWGYRSLANPFVGDRKEKLVERVERLPAKLRIPVLRSERMYRARGPFAFQSNTSTRGYEYPWVFDQVQRLGPSRVLEIGGALSGFQFVLAKSGYEVHNVDPFFDYGTGSAGQYELDPIAEHAAMNRSFGTDVTLHRETLSEANLTGQFSAVLCISTIEHLSEQDIASTLAAAKGVLAPGGLLVLTVDLFLNLEPFCDRKTNEWGSNTSIAWIEELSGYEMVVGDRSELYGYSEFTVAKILSRLEEFAISTEYPQMAQLITFRAPER
jgi:2-polyprenyl-3-methyl-5-hydroxy-6-metoxy-1,4-benzoquinol methylase